MKRMIKIIGLLVAAMWVFSVGEARGQGKVYPFTCKEGEDEFVYEMEEMELCSSSKDLILSYSIKIAVLVKKDKSSVAIRLTSGFFNLDNKKYGKIFRAKKDIIFELSDGGKVRKTNKNEREMEGKEFFILTTNQDTQFVKLYPEEKVSEIQGDHRFFQCSKCCCDDTWDAVKPVDDMIRAMGDGTYIPTELIPRCPHCGAEAFPWVRGYGNFLQGRKYNEEYEKISKYIMDNGKKKILFLELGVGRMTPMFIQEPFWNLTMNLPDARYIAVNDKYAFLPKDIEDKGMAICGDIGKVLEDAAKGMEE